MVTSAQLKLVLLLGCQVCGRALGERFLDIIFLFSIEEDIF